MGFFDSSSSSSSNTTNQNSGAQGGNGSTNTDNSQRINGSNNVMTDHGAVGASFGFAEKVSQNAVNTQAAAMDMVRKTSDNALQKVTDTLTSVKSGEYKMMAMGIAVIVAIVALKSFKG